MTARDRDKPGNSPPPPHSAPRDKMLEEFPVCATIIQNYSRSGGTPMNDNKPVYALNLFNIVNIEEYLEYSRRSAKEVASHGGRILALGRFRESVTGDIEPRSVLILVEWQSREAFRNYLDDPALSDLHPHRERGASRYIWHLFDRLDDLRPLLKVTA